MADGINVVTLNTRGLRNIMKLKEVLTWLQLKEAKLIFLQETHTISESEYVWRQEWEGSLFFSHGTSNSKGTCILIHKSLPFTVYKSIQDKDGRYVMIDAEINGLRLTLYNIYGPNEDAADLYPRPVLAFWYCRLRLSVCMSVCVCINHVLVRAITHHRFKLGSPNLDHRCKRPWLRSLLFWGAIDLDLQGQIELQSQNLPHFELVITHHQLKLQFPNLEQKCILALFRFFNFKPRPN